MPALSAGEPRPSDDVRRRKPMITMQYDKGPDPLRGSLRVCRGMLRHNTDRPQWSNWKGKRTVKTNHQFCGEYRLPTNCYKAVRHRNIHSSKNSIINKYLMNRALKRSLLPRTIRLDPRFMIDVDCIARLPFSLGYFSSLNIRFLKTLSIPLLQNISCKGSI